MTKSLGTWVTSSSEVLGRFFATSSVEGLLVNSGGTTGGTTTATWEVLGGFEIVRLAMFVRGRLPEATRAETGIVLEDTAVGLVFAGGTECAIGFNCKGGGLRSDSNCDASACTFSHSAGLGWRARYFLKCSRACARVFAFCWVTMPRFKRAGA